MNNVFKGCMPALMTPCNNDYSPNFELLLGKARELIDTGMSAVIYCGSMGDWPLLSDEQRQQGVAKLVNAGIPTIVGTGAINSKKATAHAQHAQEVGALGLMVIPRVLSRGPSLIAQRSHFASILSAAPDLPAVIYNSHNYGFSTKADLFFDLRREFPNLVGFKEFGGVDMSAELRCENKWEPLLYARSRIVHAAASAGIDAIDVPYLDLDDLDGMKKEAIKAKELGFSGKGSIHPKQISVLNDVFTPSIEVIERAKEITSTFEEANTGLVVIDGKLIEKPVLREMYRILSIANKLNN